MLFYRFIYLYISTTTSEKKNNKEHNRHQIKFEKCSDKNGPKDDCGMMMDKKQTKKDEKKTLNGFEKFFFSKVT